jgi:hypothetical protein
MHASPSHLQTNPAHLRPYSWHPHQRSSHLHCLRFICKHLRSIRIRFIFTWTHIRGDCDPFSGGRALHEMVAICRRSFYVHFAERTTQLRRRQTCCKVAYIHSERLLFHLKDVAAHSAHKQRHPQAVHLHSHGVKPHSGVRIRYSDTSRLDQNGRRAVVAGIFSTRRLSAGVGRGNRRAAAWRACFIYTRT